MANQNKRIYHTYEKTLFNHFWQFRKETDQKQQESSFQDVVLPHDWLIYDTNNLYETGIGWYKKTLHISPKELAQYVLNFDGVYMDTTVFVNGQVAGQWTYGYSAFYVDMTDFLIEGNNEILVKVNYVTPNSRWYSGAGIYRDVHLIIRDQCHIVSDGIYVHSVKNKDVYEIEIVTEVSEGTEGRIRHRILYKDKAIAVSEGDVRVDTQLMEVKQPLLWSMDAPNLYTLHTELIIDGHTVQSIYTDIGFKEIVMDPQNGLFVNGEHTKLNGVCEHHDLGCLGAAYHSEAMKRRLIQLKSMGVNAIRTAHNMPSKDFMNLCDSMGFLVVSEGFDMWEKPKNPYDYARYFKDWIHKDVASWIRRDRNHVSLLMWSIGNEIYDTHADENGLRITKDLLKLVQTHDPKGNGKVTIGSNFMGWENACKCADIVKYAGYNYDEKLYEEHHQAHEDWIIYGSETGSIVQSRGIYHFPLREGILVEDDKQCSSLGNSTTSWGASSLEDCLVEDRNMEFSLGQFIWTGFDYIGEPTPYDTKNSYFGQIDTAGFYKDSYYVYKAFWSEEPMIHLFPYWQFNEGQIIDVRVATNCYKVSLYLNDQLIGTKIIDRTKKDSLIPTWQVSFIPGTLKAIAFNRNNEIIAEAQRQSFQEPSQLVCQIEKEVLLANGSDLTGIAISVIDENGHPVENAKAPVKVSVSGAGVLLGMDNGDSTDYTQYKSHVRSMFSGKVKAFIGSLLEPGVIEITVEMKNCKPVKLFVESQKTTLSKEQKQALDAGLLLRSGQVDKSYLDENHLYHYTPIDSISLAATKKVLNQKNKEVLVKAKIVPEYSSSQPLVWKAVNEKGIESNLVTIDATETSCRVKAVGDGVFYLRCMANNGKNHGDVISELKMEVRDFGQALLNPYEMVSAALYNDCLGDIQSGNEKGIGIMEKEVMISYGPIDFGRFGSDKMTVSIFSFDSSPIRIQVWEGNPSREGKLIDTLIYEKETIWNQYQEMTFRLSKRLKGTKNISFLLGGRLHMKGFYFEYMNPAFEKISINDYDQCYGDYYEETDWGVADIGNNVVFIFDEMDFGEGAVAIEICGRSITKKNTIGIMFSDCESKSQQVVEFDYEEGFTVKRFPLSAIVGKGKITFMFLPGSHFDFKWFRFIQK